MRAIVLDDAELNNLLNNSPPRGGVFARSGADPPVCGVRGFENRARAA
jgi:hypothetical protein